MYRKILFFKTTLKKQRKIIRELLNIWINIMEKIGLKNYQLNLLDLSKRFTTPHKIYAQIRFSTNRQTFNKNFVTAEKSPIFKPHKS